MSDYLPCPDCGTPAIPASECSEQYGATWTEDDEADCPGCGQHLVARSTSDGEDEWIEAVVDDGKGMK